MSSLNLSSLQVAATNMQNVSNVKLANANQTPASSLEYLYQAISLIETKNQLTSNVLNNTSSNTNNNQIQQQQKSIQATFHNDYSANLINENKKRIIGNLMYQQQQQNQHQNLANNNENLRFINLNTNNKNLNNKSKNQPEMILNCSCCNNQNTLGLNQTYLSHNSQNTNVKVNKPNKKEDKRISSLINKQIQLEQQQLQAQKDQKHTPPSRLEKAKQLARKINSCDYPHSCSNSSLSSASSSPIYLYPSSASNSPFSAFYPPQGTIPINSNYYPIDVLYTLLPLYLNPYLNKQPVNNCATNNKNNNNNNNQSNEQIQNLINLINSISTFQQQQQQNQSQFNSHQHNINDLSQLNHQLVNNNFVLYPIPSQPYQQQQQQQQHQNQQANTIINPTILNQNALPSLSVSPISSISSISSKSSTRSSFASYSSSKASKSKNLLNKSKQVDIIENFDVNSKVEEHFRRSLGNKYFNLSEMEQKSNKRLKLDENNNYITQEENNCKSPDLKPLKKDEDSCESNEDDIQSQNDFSAASSASIDDHYEANIEPVSPCSPCSVKSLYSCQDSRSPGLNINEFSNDSSASKLKTDCTSVQMKKKNDIVDTHFSKALGEDIWNRIKEKIKFGNSLDDPSEICSSLSTSVKL